MNIFKGFAEGGFAHFPVICHLADKQRSVNSVLIPHIGAGKIAAAFLKAKDETLRRFLFLQFGNNLAYKAKTGEHTAHFSAVMLCHGVCKAA